MSVVASVQYVGGPGGQYSEVQAWKVGKVITKLQVFRESERVRGACVWMTGQGQYEGLTIGKAAGSSSTFEFQSGEFITSMSLWNGRWENNDHLRAGHIRFSTNKGRSFDTGPGQIGSEYKIDVQSGILVGVQAYAGDDINRWAFVFLKPVLIFTLQDVKYPGLTDMGGIVPVTLDNLKVNNKSKKSIKWNFEGSRVETFSWEFSKTEGITTTFGFQVSAGIPEIGLGSELSYQWQISQSAARTSSYSEPKTLKWSTGTEELKPNTTASAVALTQTGNINLLYTGNMVIKVTDGSTYSYGVSGTYSGLSVTDVQVNVSPVTYILPNVSKAQAEAQTTEAESPAKTEESEVKKQ